MHENIIYAQEHKSPHGLHSYCDPRCCLIH